ncbi:hypothetical protein CcaCcLH18_09429 [Colletotrichum camelliae]|nr:hypothetical protein CcaCcLH18_09429 [Colletotrichum camelliae]
MSFYCLISDDEQRKQGDAPEKTAMRNGLYQHALAHLVARDRPFALGQGPASPAASRQAVKRSTACLSGLSAIVRNPTCTAHHEFASAVDSVTNSDVAAQ